MTHHPQKQTFSKIQKNNCFSPLQEHDCQRYLAFIATLALAASDANGMQLRPCKARSVTWLAVNCRAHTNRQVRVASVRALGEVAKRGDSFVSSAAWLIKFRDVRMILLPKKHQKTIHRKYCFMLLGHHPFIRFSMYGEPLVRSCTDIVQYRHAWAMYMAGPPVNYPIEQVRLPQSQKHLLEMPGLQQPKQST